MADLDRPWLGLPVAARWWHAERVSERVTRLWEPHVDPLLRCSAWHVRGSRRDLLVDAGLGIVSLRESFPDLFDRELLAVATHSHHDHSGGLHEFDEVGIHPVEAELISGPLQGRGSGLIGSEFDAEERMYLRSTGYAVPDVLLTALPHPGYDPSAYRLRPVVATRLLREGDEIDLGGTTLRVMEVPGHTPGSIALLDVSARALFSGDALYDGPLLAGLPESDLDAYVGTMRRLLGLPMDVVHPGHEQSFDARRKDDLIARFLGEHTTLHPRL